VSELCTLEDFQTYTGNTTAGVEDAVNALIPQVSDMIEQYCQRTFASATVTETRNGNNGGRLFVKQPPVTAISSLTVDGVAVPVSSGPLSYGYVFDDEGWVYIREGRDGPFGTAAVRFNRGIQNVVIAYTGGFDPIPPAVVQAAVELIAWKLAKRARIDKKSETLAQQTVGFEMAGWPDSVLQGLASYRITRVNT
jgi:hypothetical protein